MCYPLDMSLQTHVLLPLCLKPHNYALAGCAFVIAVARPLSIHSMVFLFVSQYPFCLTQFPSYWSLALQVAVPINSALAKLRSAGAVLVPFDSTTFQELAVSAWPGATAETINNLDASSDYESIEVLGRQVAGTETVHHTMFWPCSACSHSMPVYLTHLHATYAALPGHLLHLHQLGHATISKACFDTTS